MAPNMMSKPAATPVLRLHPRRRNGSRDAPGQAKPAPVVPGRVILLRRKSPHIAGNLRDQTGHLADYRRNWGNLFSVLYCR